MTLIAELVDKTQLATAGLAAEGGAPLEAFIGSSVALWSVSLLAIFFGRQLTGWIPLQRIQQAGGIIFLAFAAMSLYQAFALRVLTKLGQACCPRTFPLAGPTSATPPRGVAPRRRAERWSGWTASAERPS
jgi:hypothetical protein